MNKRKIQSMLIALVIAVETIVVPITAYGAQMVSGNEVVVNEQSEYVEVENADTKMVSEEKIAEPDAEEVPAEKATIKYSGKSGDLDWSIDTNGHLTITGNGNYEMLEKEGKFIVGGVECTKLSGPHWIEYYSEIKSATVSVTGITYMEAMFKWCENMTTIDFGGIDTSQVTSMAYMFSCCSSLTSLNVSDFITSNVNDMKYMFASCSSLTGIDVSNFDTSKVKYMNGMFSGCSSLTSLNISNFITSQVIYMYDMFSECRSLTGIDVSNFDTSKVTAMFSMFLDCSSLTSLNVSNFDTSQVTSMGRMFSGCSSLTSINLGDFKTNQDASIYCMFYGCSSLTSIDLSKFDTSKVTDMWGMFSGCSSLTSLDVSNFDTDQVTGMSSMFYGCSKLTSLDLSGFETGQVTSMGSMFSGCSSLTNLNVSNFDTSQVTNMASMFSGCSSLTSLDVSNFDTSQVMFMTSMFSGCSSLTSLDVSSFDMSNEKYGNFIYSCDNLVTIKSPRNINQEIALPELTDHIWKDASGNICTQMTKGLNYSVIYTRCDNIENSVTVVSPVPTQIYNGKEITPLPIVTYNGIALQKDIDYTLTYTNNVNPGTATIIITGKGKYYGTQTVTFIIDVQLQKAQIDTIDFTYQKGNLAKLNSKLYYSLYLDFVPVDQAKIYEIELTNNKGKKVKTETIDCANKDYINKTIKNLTGSVYGVRIRAKHDNVYGEWSQKSYVIRQPRAQARTYKGNVQIKWEKLSGATGYDIYMSTGRNGKYKKVASAGKNTTLKTIKKYNKKKLQSKTYYYYVVAKKKVGSKTYKSSKSFVYKVKNKA